MPSLVLTDSLMPGVDGTAVLHAVREQWPEVPVVLLSATQQTMESRQPCLYFICELVDVSGWLGCYNFQ